jgi:hypothetical protein
MGRSTRFAGAIFVALLPALAALHAPARAWGAPAPEQRTVSNVATIQWDEGGARLSKASNQVDIAVAAAPAQSYSLTAYRFSANSGSIPVNVPTPQCTAAGGPAPASLATAWQGVALAPAMLTPITEIHAGEPLLVVLDYADGNRDPNAVESVTGAVIASSGDREVLTIYETGPDTGKFAGYIQTVPAPPPGVSGDCKLTVAAGDKIVAESLRSGTQTPLASASVDVLVDPFGIAFDSVDARPVDGTRITLVDAATGQPATVFGDDGNSSYPATIVTGGSVRDGSGNVYSFPAGEYRFPFVRAGTYRLQVEPAKPYAAPSVRTPTDLAGLKRPDGQAFTLAPASYGGTITLADPAPVRIDIPLDPPAAPIQLVKSASVRDAGPGELVSYQVDVRNPDAHLPTGNLTLSDRFGAPMRLRAGTIRVDGVAVPANAAADGTGFDLSLPPLAPGAVTHVRYALEVRADAREGDAVNEARARDDRGHASNVGDAAVRIHRDEISNRLTIEGRVVDGACGVEGRGIAAVRVMLEDGSYAVTDPDGRYHFEGIVPGTHVVQVDDATLPSDRALTDCAHDTRSGGRAFSRFVEGEGGALKRVDFHAVPSAPRASPAAAAAHRPEIPTDAAAAGAERDWFAGQEPGVAWLFPAVDHNPRAPVVRVAIKHLPGQSVKLMSGGRPVDAVAFDGTRKNEVGTVAVSLWRAIPLAEGATDFTAEVRNADGSLAQTLTRTVHYGSSPMQAELLRDRSVLVADGVTRPVIAVRLTDRDGRPVRHGLVGDFELPSPYYPAVEADAQQARQLAGLERARPFWRVQGDDGVAYIELEPTTASGSVSLRFNFKEGTAVREQRIEAWLDPGQRPWTIVGLAEGTVGYNRLSGRMEGLAGEKDKVLTDGRLALYAKGRILGKWLMTLAYDSDKKADDTRFAGTIDPRAYYTVYADRSERRYDAASVRKLYLKVERPQFYALFGDYETGIDEPQLARYVRAFNGAKAEYRSARVSATAFAADAPTTHRRDDIQGNGLTGPYALGSRDILANSERVTIEVRDRLRSDRIVDSRLLIRHADYEIDYRSGILTFKAPVLSRTSDLDPQFIVAEYEVDGIARRTLNAGGRATWRSRDGKLQVGATAIHDSDERQSTNLGGADLRFRPNASTEIRAEAAVSDNRAKPGSGAASGGTAAAWLVEAEHHGSRYDLLAYARQQDKGFGVGQLSGVEAGTRKFGFDGRVKFTDRLTLTASAWLEDYLASDAQRIAARALLEYRSNGFTGRAGLTFADDRLEDGRTARSTLLQLGATKRFFSNKLELDAQTEIPLDKAESVDFPARHRVSARYAFSNSVSLVAAYEIADGEHVDARTARVGFDLQPWAGAHITLSGNQQDIAEYGPRSFAAFGLSQSLTLGKHWSIDLSLDSNKTLGGIDPARVLNPLHPVASGGFVGGSGLGEDFTAATAGATYRSGLWTITGRAEFRDGEQDNRYGFTAGFIRQLGEGSAVGGAFNRFTAEAAGDAETRTTSLQLSWAHRPAGSAFTWLEKLELREDQVTGAVAGAPGPLGPLTVTGDLRSRRFVNSLSANYSPSDRQEITFFWGSRYASDKVESDDVAGWSNVVGADWRIDLSNAVDIGLGANLREGIGGRSFAWSAGPSIGLKPFDNGWISIGWNVVGFHDRDFEDARYTRSGPYVTMRFKFDQSTLAGLGITGR